jgi:hypothetical protein
MIKPNTSTNNNSDTIKDIISTIESQSTQWYVYIPNYKSGVTEIQSIWNSNKNQSDITKAREAITQRLSRLTPDQLSLLQDTLKELVRFKSKMSMIGISVEITYSNINDSLPLNGSTKYSKLGTFEINYNYRTLPQIQCQGDTTTVLNISQKLLNSNIVTWNKNTTSILETVSRNERPNLLIDFGNYALDYTIFSSALTYEINVLQRQSFIYTAILHVKNLYVYEALFERCGIIVDTTNIVNTTKRLVHTLPEFILNCKEKELDKESIPDVVQFLTFRSQVLSEKIKLVFCVTQLIICKDFAETFRSLNKQCKNKCTLEYSIYAMFLRTLNDSTGFLNKLAVINTRLGNHPEVDHRLGFEDCYIGLEASEIEKFKKPSASSVIYKQNRIDAQLNKIIDIVDSNQGSLTKSFNINVNTLKQVQITPELLNSSDTDVEISTIQLEDKVGSTLVSLITKFNNMIDKNFIVSADYLENQRGIYK